VGLVEKNDPLNLVKFILTFFFC